MQPAHTPLARLEPELASFSVAVHVLRRLVEASHGGRRVAEVLVADATASAIVQAVDGEIDALTPGTWVAIERCAVQMTPQRQMRVVLGRWSRIAPLPAPDGVTANDDDNAGGAIGAGGPGAFVENPCVSAHDYTAPRVASVVPVASNRRTRTCTHQPDLTTRAKLDDELIGQCVWPAFSRRSEMAADFAAGTLGGIAGVVVGYPADTIKVRLQSSLVDAATGRPLYRGTWHCLTSIVRQETLLGLFKGMSSPVAAVGLINSLLFGVYGHLLRAQQTPEQCNQRPTVRQVFWAGVGSGLLNSFIACPVELAKIRLQNQATGAEGTARFSGPLDYLRHAYRASGLRGCYRGITATVLRETPSYGVYFASYETLCQWLTPAGRSVDDLAWPHLLLAGGLSGIAGWVCIYPIDVVKTKLQADSPTAYKHTLDCFVKSYQSQGLRVFGSGLTATLLRAFPTNAATLLVYTVCMRLFHQHSQGRSGTPYDVEPSRTAAAATAALE